MVWFHGGGFQCGAGIAEYYGPDFLLDHNIIYIGANFRLGKLIINEIDNRFEIAC